LVKRWLARIALVQGAKEALPAACAPTLRGGDRGRAVLSAGRLGDRRGLLFMTQDLMSARLFLLLFTIGAAFLNGIGGQP
jgi:hypothetical protein